MNLNLSCPTCRKTVEPGLFGMRLECNHWVHGKCLDKENPDFEKCAACKGEVDLNIPQFDKDEPESVSGRDYIREPLSNSYFTSLKRSVNKEPFKWLSEKSPLEWIIKEKGYHLQKMIQSGVLIDDFLNAGYTFKDLKAFKAFGNPEQLDRGKDALFALKCNAEHFRDYSHLFGDVINELGINGRDLVEKFGFCFETNTCNPLKVVGGKNTTPWTAKDLVNLNFKMKDLYGAGISYVEQYIMLSPTKEDIIGMEVDDRDVEDLPSVDALAKQMKENEERIQVLTQTQTPIQTYIERESVIPVFEFEKPRKTHGLRTRK